MQKKETQQHEVIISNPLNQIILLVITKVNEKICNLEREYRDCIKAEETRLGSQGIS